MLKTFLLVVVAVILGGAGHVMLSKGIRPVGDLTEAPSGRLGGMVTRVLSSHWVIVGVALQAVFFLVDVVLLSRADVSQLLPMTALDYVVVALLAQWALGEIITPIRWVGIGLITVGVMLVSRT
jgi:drug/metabolite transporter (DMT)-like permease